MAQLVEHNLAKVGVAGSSPVVRSIACFRADSQIGPLHKWRSGQVVRQRPAKPLPPVRIRASPPEHCKRASFGAPVFFCESMRLLRHRPLAPLSVGELGCAPCTTCRPSMIRPACLGAIAPCQAEKLWTPRRPFVSLFLHPRRLGACVSFSASHRFANLNAGRSQHIISDLLKHNI